MTDDELNARFEAAFKSVHQSRVIDVYTPPRAEIFRTRPKGYQAFVMFIAGILGVFGVLALGVLYFMVTDAANWK